MALGLYRSKAFVMSEASMRDGFGIVSLEGLRDVGGFDALIVGAAGGEDTVGHSGDDPIMNELIYPSGIAEVGHLLSQS